MHYLYTTLTFFVAVLSSVADSLTMKGLFLWIALSLLFVSLGYFTSNSRIYQKQSNGRVPWFVKVFYFAPLLGMGIHNQLTRRHETYPIQKISRNIFVASRLQTRSINLLKKHDVGAILDLTAETDGLDLAYFDGDIDYLNIPVLDHCPLSNQQLEDAVNWIRHKVEKGNRVVAHCALGRGRSVMAILAYLVVTRAFPTLDDALAHIRSIRPRARLNPQQYRALALYLEKHCDADKKTLCLIANPASGGKRWVDIKQEVIETLSPQFSLTIRETTRDVTAKYLAKQAVAAGFDRIVACGGDGTVNEVASQLINKPIKLGVIPAGTANSFSHALWGNKAKLFPVSTACQILIEGYSTTIDTARCNDQPALLFIALGFAQKMIDHADRKEKDNSGQLAYVQGVFQAVSENKSMKLTVMFDEKTRETIETSSFVIANAAPVTTVFALGAGTPDPEDGSLDITWLDKSESSSKSLFSLAELMASGIAGQNIGLSVSHQTAQKIKVRSDEALNYMIDGETFETDCLDVHILPKSLQVMTVQTTKA